MAPKRSQKTSSRTSRQPSSRQPSHKPKNPAHWEGDQYLLEQEKSTDPTKPGWIFTEAAERAQKQKWERLIANRPPRSIIPPKLLGSSGTNPPLLYFGWPFKKNYMVEYARRHSLTFQPPRKLRAVLKCGQEFNFADITHDHYRDKELMIGLRSIAKILVLTKLTSETGVQLSVARPFSLEYPYILVMWSNYNIEERYEPLDALGMIEPAVDTLREAMNEDPQEPTELQWWWAWDNDVGVFTSQE